MAAASVLEGKSAVGVSGNVSAGATPSNFTIQGTPADVANYARQGSDLVVQMKNGQTFTIQNFSAQGMGFNNLVFAQGETVSVVNFSRAASALGDGIIDALVTTQVVGAGVSTTTLLGILGAAAAAGGVAIAVSENDNDEATDPTISGDTTPPAAPTGFSLSDDSGVSATDGVTNVNVQHFSGKAEAGSSVELFLNGSSIGTVTADANGNWSFDYTATQLSDGGYTLTAKAKDAAGNVSDVSAPLEFAVDTVVNMPANIAIQDSDGAVLDRLTNINHLIFTGDAESGSVVTLRLDGMTIGTATADSDGRWTFDYSANVVPDGQYALRATATDLAGNVSNDGVYKFEVDTTTAMPTGIAVLDGNGATLGDLTNVNALMFTGLAEADSVVELFLDGTSIGTATAGANGQWEFDYTDILISDGEHTLTARATDQAGNVSPVSAAYTVTVDTAAPVAPSELIAADGGGSEIVDGTTPARDLVFSGAAEADSKVELLLNGIFIGLVQADANGQWEFDYTGTLLDYGNYELTATATDRAGNVSTPATYLFEVDAVTFGADVKLTNRFQGSYITFTFNEPVLPATLNLNGIIVKNGALKPGAQPQWSGDNTEFTIEVVPDFGQNNTNVAVTLLKGSVSSDLGEVNAQGKNVTSLNNLFNSSSSLTLGDITNWDTSHAVSAEGTFMSNQNFNQDISGWDMSNVTTMFRMFSGAIQFNQDIGGWDVSSVTRLDFTFNQAQVFNQSLNGWDTSSVTTTMAMFQFASAFNGAVNQWNTSSVQDMSFMFSHATLFNQDIGGWDTGNVTNMDSMFQGTQNFDQNVGKWNISSLTTAVGMFQNGAGISVENMDLTIRGWAKSAMIGNAQAGVVWGVSTYTDATAVEYLRQEHGWTIETSKLQNGLNIKVDTIGTNTLMAFSGSDHIMHGLDGDDTITGNSGNDWIVGGEGMDILAGGDGADTFHYGFKNAGSDIITDFDTSEGDVIHLADLLVGYDSATSILANFITAADNTLGGTLLTVHYDGSGAAADIVQIELQNVAYSTSLLDGLIAGGNLVLA